MSESYDVAIVGAGPIGLELAAVLQHLGLRHLHLEAGQLGQTITWYPPQTRFFSSPERIAIAGVPFQTVDQTKATREEYLTYLRCVAEQFGLPLHTCERLTGLERGEAGFTLHTERRGQAHRYAARRVVLAVGDMHRPRMLGVEGEDRPHVRHYFDEPHFYFGQRVLFVGGKNSVAEAALRCYRAGAKVAISYRRPAFSERSIKYWLLPELNSLIKHGRIAFYPSTVPERIGPDHVTLRHLGGEDPEAESASAKAAAPREDVPADFVLALTGYEQDTSLFDLAGVNLVGENHAPEHNPRTMETNVPGVHIAGTAAAGTQQHFRLFIENCHTHVRRIAKAISGQTPPKHLINEVDRDLGLPES